MDPALRRPGKELGPRGSRAIAAIVTATRQIFSERGYLGTSVDEIARTAGMSRASFYTYFSSKRDVLLVLGAAAVDDADRLVEELDGLGPRPPADRLDRWVDRYFSFLGEHGSFAFAWTQAARLDPDLLTAGRRAHLGLCGRMGRTLGRVRGRPPTDPVAAGLSAFAALERAWDYCRLYGTAVDERTVKADLAEMLVAGR